MTSEVGSSAAAGMGNADTIAVPTLRVMRLQSPELHQSTAGTLVGGNSLLERSLCLPDSLAVYVGECFTAYLGILNTSSNWPIRRLTVAAQLQTPSQRWQLPCPQDGVDVEPLSGTDSIVSHLIEEAGQHILRVEVGYMTADGGSKTFRKFYRFQVTSPLSIRHSVRRCGDSACLVSLEVQYNLQTADSSNASGTPLVISDASFVAADGLQAQRIVSSSSGKTDNDDSALALFDNCTILNKGTTVRYVFRIEATSPESILKGISADDVLGKAVFRWRKAMGETGECSSIAIVCPPVDTSMVHRSGLSVDLAAAAASPYPQKHRLLTSLPVSVEPIDPPTTLVVNRSQTVQFLVVNHHSDQSINIQWQLRSALVCGRHFQSVGEVASRGGSTVITAKLLARDLGLVTLTGCFIVDVVTGQEWEQPALFQVLVVDDESQ